MTLPHRGRLSNCATRPKTAKRDGLTVIAIWATVALLTLLVVAMGVN